jgi:hypothetical protein
MLPASVQQHLLDFADAGRLMLNSGHLQVAAGHLQSVFHSAFK